jgi:DNA-binding GntR family transcriptional regulator
MTPLHADNTSEIREQERAQPSVDISLRIERQSLAKQVAERLSDMIVENLLKPGDKLNERSLAQTLHVSRTPLRDGMKLLAGDGLITASDEAIAAIHDTYDRMLKALRRRDRIACFKLEQHIHLGIARACGNATLQRLHHRLNARLYRARFSSISADPWGQGRWTMFVSDLDAIIAALEQRDAATLSRLLKEHLGITWRQVQPAAKAILAPMQKRRGA